MSGFHLQVRTGELRATLPANAVRQVARGLSVAPLPGAYGALLGLVEFGGEPLPVIDLGRALGQGGIAGGTPPVTVFAWIGAGAERQLVGLAVDEAIDVTRAPAPQEGAPAGDPPYSGGHSPPDGGGHSAAAKPDGNALRIVDLETLGLFPGPGGNG